MLCCCKEGRQICYGVEKHDGRNGISEGKREEITSENHAAVRLSRPVALVSLNWLIGAREDLEVSESARNRAHMNTRKAILFTVIFTVACRVRACSGIRKSRDSLM